MQHTSRTRASTHSASVTGGFQYQKGAQSPAMKAQTRAPGKAYIGSVLIVRPSILQAATVCIGCWSSCIPGRQTTTRRSLNRI
eukprot:4364783-Prorocentrum_lima.AAC.1